MLESSPDFSKEARVQNTRPSIPVIGSIFGVPEKGLSSQNATVNSFTHRGRISGPYSLKTLFVAIDEGGSDQRLPAQCRAG